MDFITKKEASILKQLQDAFPDSSITTLRSWIAQKRIRIGETKVLRADQMIAEGVCVCFLPKQLPKEGPLRIVYEDGDLIVVDKPAGLLSVANDKKNLPSAHAWIKHRYPGKNIPVLHRLDQETSGLLIFPLNLNAFSILKNMLSKKEICRVYRAVVEGNVLESKGTWSHYVRENAYLMMEVFTHPISGSEKAVTHYEVIEKYLSYTVIDCILETGKKNQIRAQAAFSGFPIAGDKKYKAKLYAKRLCLHARYLSFFHPRTGKKLVFESEPPISFMYVARTAHPKLWIQGKRNSFGSGKEEFIREEKDPRHRQKNQASNKKDRVKS